MMYSVGLPEINIEMRSCPLFLITIVIIPEMHEKVAILVMSNLWLRSQNIPRQWKNSLSVFSGETLAHQSNRLD